jgi:hypothetical protein
MYLNYDDFGMLLFFISRRKTLTLFSLRCFKLYNFYKERTAGVTGQQRMLTPPRHLILPEGVPEVRVSLIFTVDYSTYPIWALILTTGFFVYVAGLTNFDCGLFRSPNLDTLNLITDI